MQSLTICVCCHETDSHGSLSMRQFCASSHCCIVVLVVFDDLSSVQLSATIYSFVV